MRTRSAATTVLCVAPLVGCSLLLPLDELDNGTAARDAQALGDAQGGAEAGVDGATSDAGATCTAESIRSDPNNCGACGHVCCGSVCVDGGCLPGVARALEDPSNQPYALAVDPDGGAVFWSHMKDGGAAVVRMDTATLSKKEIATSLGPNVNAIAAGALGIYVALDDGRVGLLPATGGALVPIHAGEIRPRAIVVAGARVWWTEAGYGVTANRDGNVRAADLDGRNARVVYGSRVGPAGIAVSGTTLAWAEFESDDIAIGTTAGGAAPTTTLPGESRASSMVADGADLYWTDYTLSHVRHLVLGGSPETLDSPPQNSSAAGLALDARTIYWLARSASGSLWATPRNGQPHVAMQQNLRCPTQVAVDDACVYWIEQGSCDYPADTSVVAGTGRVMRTDKPL